MKLYCILKICRESRCQVQFPPSIQKDKTIKGNRYARLLTYRNCFTVYLKLISYNLNSHKKSWGQKAQLGMCFVIKYKGLRSASRIHTNLDKDACACHFSIGEEDTGGSPRLSGQASLAELVRPRS